MLDQSPRAQRKGNTFTGCDTKEHEHVLARRVEGQIIKTVTDDIKMLFANKTSVSYEYCA
jgi:hypothetical protein